MGTSVSINLLERHKTTIRRRRARVARLQVLSFVLAGSYAAVLAMVMVFQFVVSNNLSEIEDSIVDEQRRIQQYGRAEGLLYLVKHKLSLVEEIYENPKTYTYVVEKLRGLLPEGVGIGSYDFGSSAREVSVGIRMDDYFVYREFIDGFEEAIATDEELSRASVGSTSRTELGEYQLSLDIDLEDIDAKE